MKKKPLKDKLESIMGELMEMKILLRKEGNHEALMLADGVHLAWIHTRRALEKF